MSQTDNNLPYASDAPLDVAIWLDPTMLSREAAFVRHLVMGLMSEGQHVSFIANQAMDLTSLPTLGSRLITYRWNRWERFSVLQRYRLGPVIEELQESPPDVLLVWGSGATVDHAPLEILLHALQIPTIVWCWDGSELFAPLMSSPHVKHAIVSSQPIAARVPANFRVPVTLIPPGVYAEDTLACYDVEGQTPCLISLDPLSDIKAYEALIRACRRLADENLDFLLFAYDTGRQEHPIWQLAERLKLLDRISFVPFQQDAEPLLMHGDLYLHVLPTSRVQYRTLDAMARGLVVVTPPNPGADYLLDNQTARIVSSPAGAPSPDAWYSVLLDLLQDRPKTIHLARRGQQLIRDRYPMTRAITQFTSVCRQTAGTPLRLSAQT